MPRGSLGGLAALSAAAGAPVPLAGRVPDGLLPAALAEDDKSDATAAKGLNKLGFPGRDGNLLVLLDDPLVAETPEGLLDDDTTPTTRFFIRNDGPIPDAVADADACKLTIDGEVNQPLEITLGDLKKRGQPKTLRRCWNAPAMEARSLRRARPANSGPTAGSAAPSGRELR